MKMMTGLFDYMVLQRNKRNVSEAGFTGTCTNGGTVTATVKAGGRTVKGFAGIAVGVAARGQLKGCLKGLPVGGPYEITFKAGTETQVVKDVLVGDVWLLGGQSNMQGCGLFPKLRLQADPLVRAFAMDDRWSVARDPIHTLWKCVDAVHVDLNGGARHVKPPADWGVCPGPAFGNEMRRLSGVPQGLIACAHGGTSMSQWDPKRKKEGGKSLYGALVRRLVKNGGRVAGMIWYQGCSDANQESVNQYTPRMKELVRALRRDCGDKTLPVAIVQIGRVVNFSASFYWNSIQEQQRRLPCRIRNLTTVPAIDLAMDDHIHISGAGHYVLGRRLAQAMQALRLGRKAGNPPIAIKQVTIESDRGLGVVVVEFDNVGGQLRSGSRPTGFSIVSPAVGANNLFDIQLDGSRARIRSTLTTPALHGAALHYGYGSDPCCNITDKAGRPLPVFGPIAMGFPRAFTPFINKLRVSTFQPVTAGLKSVRCPSRRETGRMTPREFPDSFCNLHPEIAVRGGANERVFFACRVTCDEAMQLRLLLGYDGPVKAWVDGKAVATDPKGTNPANPEQIKAAFNASKGHHEIVVALDTNKGAAWGIFLQLERRDVAKPKLKQGPGAYSMPVLLG
jgi:hypothetical protein